MPNLAMPGNSRYQPKSLEPYFGHDNLARFIVEVELAVMKTLGRLEVILPRDFRLLTPEVEKELLAIPMSEMDRVERTETEYGRPTRHDIRALVRIMQAKLPPPLRRWVHVPLTSYDALDTARMLMYVRAHKKVVQPKTEELLQAFIAQVRRYAATPQIGRTHGQHALPITVGFWLATILSRVNYGKEWMRLTVDGLMGKISGAVGAYNAQEGLGIYQPFEGKTFEAMVLERLGLVPAPISTQILPPEPLAHYLFTGVLTSGALAQFGRDSRHLMRTEIGELMEPFEKGQVGSSTMAHKRNPLNFENTDGMFISNKNMFMNVFDTLISEHQRDLVGSSVTRDFPAIVVRLIYQLETLLRAGAKDPRPFVERLTIDEEACNRNLTLQGDAVLAEPFYLMLQHAGYPGDAHALVNEQAMPLAKQHRISLFEAITRVLAAADKDVATAVGNWPSKVTEAFARPVDYVGKAQKKALEIADQVEGQLST